MQNLNQKELAKRIGCSPVAVGKWCAEKVMPREEFLHKICDVLHCQEEDLLSDNLNRETPEYYPSMGTAKGGQTIYSDPYLHMLFDAARGASPDDIMLVAGRVKAPEADKSKGELIFTQKEPGLNREPGLF